jgi:hypothetical protein
MLLKWYAADPALRYPDMGCSCELFASDQMLEIETLSPVTVLEPGAWVDHSERWSLHRGLTVPESADQALDQTLLPFLALR